MANKKKNDSGLPEDPEQDPIDVVPVSTTPILPAKKVWYTSVMWMGDVKEVQKCSICGANRDDKDSMIEHVLLHVPASEREAVFEELMKEA